MPYDNNNSGALFRNDRKESPKHPDYRGQCEIDGVEFWMSAWIRESKKGAKFMSIKFKPKEEQDNGEPRRFRDQDDEDIPF